MANGHHLTDANTCDNNSKKVNNVDVMVINTEKNEMSVINIPIGVTVSSNSNNNYTCEADDDHEVSEINSNNYVNNVVLILRIDLVPGLTPPLFYLHCTVGSLSKNIFEFEYIRIYQREILPHAASKLLIELFIHSPIKPDISPRLQYQR